ncbi:MFS transporter [Microlunatus antarcticus]|uniref:Putative MFS family arabinose efflux permease n=1 Tax=Microlunatus antarcticus TaxID=53388 RepID=A0A7W5P7G6_9ACTN|nr:putative MFS family arabinose efflux permease [Microlunatus antarcticus]
MSRPTAPPEAADAADATDAAAPREKGLARFGLTRRSAALLVGMSAALLASELAETVVATALPTIAADLGDLRLLALVTTGYLVASTAVLPAYGWLSDRYGRRRLFVVAVALFLVGSVLGALAAGPVTLVLARLVQGCGAGGLLVLVQAEVAVLVPLRQRAAVMSGVGAVFATAVIAGPPLGGWLASGPGWRWAFWLNLPLALGALVAAVALMPPGRPERQARPRSPLAVLRRRQVRYATAGGLLLGASSFGMLVYLPTYLQLVLGLSPAWAGVLMLALFGGLGILTVVAAQVVRRNGPVRALLVVGALAVAGGLALLASGAGGSLVGVVPALVLLGAGIGCVWEVVVVVVQAGVVEAEVGTATGTNNLLREIGVVVGTGLVGAWVTHRLISAGTVSGVPLGTWSPERLAAATPAAQAEVSTAYAAAFGPAFWALVPVALLAAAAFSRLRPWSRAQA